MPQKTVPQRMCLACREMKPKEELFRVVKTADGNITADPTGKLNGRGAYVCRNPECLARLKKSRQLERALKAPVGEDVWLALDAFAEGRT